MSRFQWAVLAAAITAAAPSSMVAAAHTAQAATGFKWDSAENLVHEATGTRFPARADGFTLVSSASPDAAGTYPVVVYERGAGATRAVARIALVQIEDMSALEHFAAMAPVVGSYFQDMTFDHITPLSDGPIALPGVAPRNAWQGHFSAMRDGQKYVLSLSTLDMGHWGGRITAAYPQASAADNQKRLFALVAKIRATGPEHIHAIADTVKR